MTNLTPRGLSRGEAAAYAGCESLSTFHDWVRRGILPRPIPGTHTWDRKAIDNALDRASGLVRTVTTPDDPTEALKQWEKDKAREKGKGD
jgi:hypothetical protein